MPEKFPHFGVPVNTCTCCGIPINVHQKINPGHCGSMECNFKHAQVASRRHARRRKDERDRWVDAALLREAEAIQRASDLLHAEPDAVLIATLPFQDEPVVPLPQDAREAFAAHIREVVTAAFEDVNQASVDEAVEPPSLKTPTPVEAAGCTACQGTCCALGRQFRAFLGKSAIENLIRTKSDLSMPEVIDRYVAAIPDESVEDACVYQSAEGCVLPRDWRSDTCNTYRCGPLVALAERALEDGDRPFVIVGVGESGSKILAHRDSLGTKAV